MTYSNAYPKPTKKKRVKRGGNTRTKLQVEFEDKEIYGCEVCKLEYEAGTINAPLAGCERLDPAHRHERVEYVGREDSLWIFNQVIQAGRGHHTRLDRDKKLREQVFILLRGDDTLYE